MTSICITTMSAADLPRVAELAAQLGYPDAHNNLLARFGEISAHREYALFVARSDEAAKSTSDATFAAARILGWIQVNLEPMSLLTDRRADIAALVVDETSRGQNVGAKLLQHAEKWAFEQGVLLLRLRSNTVRTDAHRFYLREGYTLAKTSCVFTKARQRSTTG